MNRVLIQAIRLLAGAHYDTSPGASKRPATIDCSRFGFDLLLCWGDAHQKQADLMLNVAADRPFANVEACVALGIGIEVVEPLPARIHYLQGWTGLDAGRITSKSRGHTSFFVAAAIPFVGEDYVLQATNNMRDALVFRGWAEHRGRWDAVRLVALNGID